MRRNRVERLQELLRAELGSLIQKKLKDPRVGFATVTRVEVSHDMKFAKVFYGVLGDEKVRKSTQIALERSAGYLQREIASVIQLRCTPRLSFKLDESIEGSIRIEEIIKKIHSEKETE
ncbi:MAG: 30S ribosome-binding factor RbfA [Candidatus Omnitrophica bacterium]|nr:30S ribosome-binding factor RbfA [Candidatus Omnitrophota bacterium]